MTSHAPQSGARTPEDLELLLEDALIVGDRDALATLFDAGSLLAANGGLPALASEDTARRALALWTAECPYLAAPRDVVATSELALIIGEHGINVMRRGHDGFWRYVIVWQTGLG